MLSFALPQRSWAHRLPAAVKFAALAVAMVALMRLGTLAGQGGALLAVAGLTASLGRHAVRLSLRAMRPLLWIIAVILAWEAWQGRALAGVVFGLRVFVMVGLANFVTLTTPLPEIIALIERMAQPLARFGFSPRIPALAVGLALRFIPELRARHAVLQDAWRARSCRRAGGRLVAPLAFSLLDDADRLAEALRARGGIAPLHSEENRNGT